MSWVWNQTCALDEVHRLTRVSQLASHYPAYRMPALGVCEAEHLSLVESRCDVDDHPLLLASLQCDRTLEVASVDGRRRSRQLVDCPATSPWHCAAYDSDKRCTTFNVQRYELRSDW